MNVPNASMIIRASYVLMIGLTPFLSPPIPILVERYLYTRIPYFDPKQEHLFVYISKIARTDHKNTSGHPDIG